MLITGGARQAQIFRQAQIGPGCCGRHFCDSHMWSACRGAAFILALESCCPLNVHPRQYISLFRPTTMGPTFWALKDSENYLHIADYHIEIYLFGIFKILCLGDLRAVRWSSMDVCRARRLPSVGTHGSSERSRCFPTPLQMVLISSCGGRHWSIQIPITSNQLVTWKLHPLVSHSKEYTSTATVNLEKSRVYPIPQTLCFSII